MSGKSRAKRRQTFTIFVDNSSAGTLFSEQAAHHLARYFYGEQKSVRIRNNDTRRVVGKYIYGRQQ